VEKIRIHCDILKTGGFNVQLQTCAGDLRLCLKAGDLTSLIDERIELLTTLMASNEKTAVLKNSGNLVPTGSVSSETGGISLTRW
jgi:hypothetical protein